MSDTNIDSSSSSTPVNEGKSEEIKNTPVYSSSSTVSSSSSSSTMVSSDSSMVSGMEGDDQQIGNLIVNYLPQRITESELRQMFEPFGPIEHVKLMLDKRTHISMGYGFVRFANAESADQAIAVLNGRQIDSKTIRVSHSRQATTQDTNLYVGNLDASVTRDTLGDLFGRYGKVLDAKVLTDRVTGESKGYGFVRLERREDCDGAIAALTGAIMPSISTRGLVVRYHRSTTSSASMSSASGRRMYGRSFASSSQNPSSSSTAAAAAAAAAASMYSVYPIASPYVSMLQVPLVPGLVFPQQQQQQQQQQATNKTQQSFQGVCVFVYNLPQGTEPVMLKNMFAPHGTVTNAKVMRNADGRCRGFGFVNLSTMDEALKAISALNGTVFMGRTLQVSLKTDK